VVNKGGINKVYMKRVCSNCYYFYECDDKEEDPPYDICQNFFANYSEEISSKGWYEMSWNRYTDDLLDYGEESEWDKFVEEK
jgi:hypothetical protein